MMMLPYSDCVGSTCGTTFVYLATRQFPRETVHYFPAFGFTSQRLYDDLIRGTVGCTDRISDER